MAANELIDLQHTLEDLKNALKFIVEAAAHSYGNPAPYIDAVVSISKDWIGTLESSILDLQIVQAKAA